MSIVGEWQPVDEFNPNNCKEGDRFVFLYIDQRTDLATFKNLCLRFDKPLLVIKPTHFAKINPPC